MFKNYLTITLRNFIKNKVFVLVNLLGMSIAIGCCIVAYLNYDFNVNFDEDQSDINSIYRVDVLRDYQGEERMWGMSPLPIGNAIRENIGDVEEVLRYIPSGGNFRVGDELFNNDFTYVDENFFGLFKFKPIAGDFSGLHDKSNIYINSEIAEKYFGNQNPVGQILTHLTNNGPKDYRIAGIFEKMPLNSSFADVTTICNIENYFDLNSEEDVENSWLHWSTTFVKLSDKNRIPLIEKQLDEYVEIQNMARLDFIVSGYVLEPFEGMGRRAANDEVYGHWLHSSLPPPAVIVPGLMAILILLIACFNFTNTSIAISSKRLKEIGLRKVMGGLKIQLVIQFMLENLLLCFLSLLIGLILAAFLVPAYSNMWAFLEISFDVLENVGFFMFLIILLIATALVAGIYPAFYISKFQPAGILKGTIKLGGANRLTNSLLALQFSISLMAIILGFIFYQNAIYQEEIDLGYDQDGIITVYVNNEDEYRALENSLKQDNRIKSIGASEYQINRSYRNDPVISGDKEYDVDILHVGEKYLQTMDFKLLEGREFTENSETDFVESVLVSQEMVKVFGWNDPIGQRVTWMDSVQLYVIGVVKDPYLNGLWEPVNPLLIRYVAPKDYRFLTAKTDPSDIVAVNEYIEKQWKELFPDRMYTGSYFDEEMSESAVINTNLLHLFMFLGAVAMLLSAVGLFSLVSLDIVKRTKEIGVRKVLGASVLHIISLLNRNFIIILIIAAAIGSVMSYYLAGILMSSIWTYFIDPKASAFIISIILMLLIAIMTIGIKVYRAATTNPVNTLRTE